MANQKQTPPLTRPCMARNQTQAPGEPAQLLRWRYDDRLFRAASRKAMQSKQKATFLPSLSLLDFKGKLDSFVNVSSLQKRKNKTLSVMNGVWQLLGTGMALKATGTWPKAFRYCKETNG